MSGRAGFRLRKKGDWYTKTSAVQIVTAAVLSLLGFLALRFRPQTAGELRGRWQAYMQTDYSVAELLDTLEAALRERLVREKE